MEGEKCHRRREARDNRGYPRFRVTCIWVFCRSAETHPSVFHWHVGMKCPLQTPLLQLGMQKLPLKVCRPLCGPYVPPRFSLDRPPGLPRGPRKHGRVPTQSRAACHQVRYCAPLAAPSVGLVGQFWNLTDAKVAPTTKSSKGLGPIGSSGPHADSEFILRVVVDPSHQVARRGRRPPRHIQYI